MGNLTGNRNLLGNTLRRPFREAAVLLIIALAGTAVSWALRSDRLPLRADPSFYKLELDAPLLDTAAARKLYDEGLTLFIDIRPITEGAVPTIPGALPVRADSFDDDLLAVFDFMQPGDPLVLFGDGNLVAVSNIAAKLKDRGYTDIHILRGGLKAWIKAGGPITSGNSTSGNQS